PKDVDETGRLLSLAKATLLDLGVPDPRRHLVLAAFDNLSTLIVSRAPFSRDDLARLHEVTAEMGFSILVSPDTPEPSEALQQIMAAPDVAALQALSAKFHLDVSPPTDDRPFFFNQLRITDPASMLRAMQADSGVIKGNLGATIVLLIIIALSFALVVLTIALPALPSVRRVSRRLISAGTVYFLLIGFGFMSVEIGVIQRLSLFLGHPVYGLASACSPSFSRPALAAWSATIYRSAAHAAWYCGVERLRFISWRCRSGCRFSSTFSKRVRS